MRNLKLFVSTLFILLVVINVNGQAKSSNVIPDAVTSGFNKKYPNAKVRRWKTEENKYVAKTEINGHRCSVAFEKNGNWVNTITRIRWTHQLPSNVYEAYKKSKYNSWDVYSLAKVEKQSGDYYRVIVDDRNAKVSSDRQPLFITEKLLEFKANGTLIQVTDISDSSADYIAGNK
ncbi:MAG TPA: PepSY-like domain-containing protein [Mucilaginibacter sp.]|jgi:hypothetical protein|nr:PepSY-like domain-containing protein [Mucilaginibacter sp.]